MYRGVALVLVSAFVSASAFGQPDAHQPDRGKRSAALDELHRERIAFELDIPYAATDHPRQRLDLFLPKDRTGDALPVIVFVHGGGWLRGDRSEGADRLLPLLRTGRYAGVSVGYRLSGDATWPAQIHDCKAAIRWIRANAGKYGLDAGRIGVWGKSAGGHLALMLGVTADVPALEGDVGPHRDVGSEVAAVANHFGVTELLAMIGEPSGLDGDGPDAPMVKLIGGALRDRPETAKAASPIPYVTPDDAPVLTVHGTADRTVPYDQAVRLDAALRTAGVASYLVTVEGGGHGDFGTAADDRLRAFFARVLLGEPVEVSTATIPHPGR